MRPAFTLVELLVAITVLTIGVLALATTASLVAGHIGEGNQLSGAAHTARSTLDSLTAQPCDGLVNGAGSATNPAVRWSVTRDSLASRIDVTVTSSLARRSRQRTFSALVPCERP